MGDDFDPATGYHVGYVPRSNWSGQTQAVRRKPEPPDLERMGDRFAVFPERPRLEWSPCGRYLVAAGHPLNEWSWPLVIWNSRNGRHIVVDPPDVTFDMPEASGRGVALIDRMTRFAWSPSGDTLAVWASLRDVCDTATSRPFPWSQYESGGERPGLRLPRGLLFLVDPPSGKITSPFDVCRGALYDSCESIRWTADGCCILADFGGQLSRWEVASGVVLREGPVDTSHGCHRSVNSNASNELFYYWREPRPGENEFRHETTSRVIIASVDGQRPAVNIDGRFFECGWHEIPDASLFMTLNWRKSAETGAKRAFVSGVSLWSPYTGEELHRLRLVPRRLSHLAPDLSMAVVGSEVRHDAIELRSGDVWSLGDHQARWESPIGNDLRPSSFPGDRITVAWHPTHRLVAVARHDLSVHVWDTYLEKFCTELSFTGLRHGNPQQKDAIAQLVWNPSGEMLAVAALGGSVHVVHESRLRLFSRTRW